MRVVECISGGYIFRTHNRRSMFPAVWNWCESKFRSLSSRLQLVYQAHLPIHIYKRESNKGLTGLEAPKCRQPPTHYSDIGIRADQELTWPTANAVSV